MSGYRAVAVDSAPKAGLSCLHCGHFLREPVQTEEGLRVCKACFAEIKSFPDGKCKKCGVSSSGPSYPDKAVQREVLALLVFCSHQQHGCKWQGSIKVWELHCSGCAFKASPCPSEGCPAMLPPQELERHLQECQYRLVSCRYCSSKVPVIELQSHNTVCLEFPITCEEEMCRSKFARKELKEHKAHQCKVVTCLYCLAKVERSTGLELPLPISGGSLKLLEPTSNSCPPSECRGEANSAPYFSSVASDQTVSASRGSRVHLSDPKQNFDHHQMMAEQVQKMEETMTSIREDRNSMSEEAVKQLQEDNMELRKEVKGLNSSLGELTAVVQTLRSDRPSHDTPSLNHTHLSKLESLAKADSERTTLVQYLKRELMNLQGEVEGLKKRPRHGLAEVQADGPSSLQQVGERDYLSSLPNRDAISPRSSAHSSLTKGDESAVSHSHMLAFEKRMEELAKQLTVIKVHSQELELQLQASLASTHNGSFLWRIPDVSRRRRDAIEERVTSIYSPPFYTGRNGYKMCIRAYLNGDGMGYKTHLSLFFVLMRGECDPLLKWPFEYKVSMILVDQTHRKHIVQTFKPTPESSSFHQPISDMNVASGCPQFAKLTIFDENCYVNNDLMFIKCIVDTTKIFHP